MNIALFGPMYNSEESKSISMLGKYLDNLGHCFYASNIEAQYLNDESLDIDKLNIMGCLSIASDIFYMQEKADLVIGVLNGRVPDESTVIKLGIAYVLGLPVLLFKLDSRIAFVTGDNSMILGLSSYPLVKSLKSLNKMLNKIEKSQCNKASINNLPANIQIFFNLGQQVYQEGNEYSKLYDDFHNNLILKGIMNSHTTDDNKECIGNKVYCSGALFSPDEQREMYYISKALEDNNYITYLPE